MSEIAMLKKERIKADFSVGDINRSDRRENHTEIPTQLKERMEQRFGVSFDNVRLHYNSDLSARMDALAYTKGNRMKIAPGQERHLHHEANVKDTKAVQLGDNKDNDKLINKRVEGKVIQAKLPDVVDWDKVYAPFNEDTIIEGTRKISDSKSLIQMLDLINDYGPKLQDKENGIRRLAHDLSMVVKKVKQHIKDNITGFSKTDLDNLKKARDGIKNLVKNTEKTIYSDEQYKDRYINEETQAGFKERKKEAAAMIDSVLKQNNDYLAKYFKVDPREGVYYNIIRCNYIKIREYLGFDQDGSENVNTDYIGFKNTYTSLPNNGAYVRPAENSQDDKTMVGTKDVGGTYISTAKNSKEEATGFNIRLSGGYRLMPNNKYTTTIITKDGKDEEREISITKAGAIIHETSHLILGTKDHAYGEKNIMDLKEDEAFNNADTYRIAAEIASGARSSPPST